MEKLVLKVEGMTCSHCEMSIQKAIREVQNVLTVKANRAKKEVEIVYNGNINLDEIKKRIEDLGYRVA